MDKNLAFGHSRSCALFQAFSNSLKHIIETLTGCSLSMVNYLDDYLFIQMSKHSCDEMVSSFLELCHLINCPVSLEKTAWASTSIEFLGMLLDGDRKIIVIPVEKRNKAMKMLNTFIDRRKATVKEIQRLASFLNFLTKAVVPGRGFIRRMYSKLGGEATLRQKGIRIGTRILKPHYHLKIDAEFRNDCQVWLLFLQESISVMRPFIDFNKVLTATEICFASDSSRNPNLGFGCVFGTRWLYRQWEPGFIETYQPSIAYLELFALCLGIITWGRFIKNGRFRVWTDNMATCYMINTGSSACKNCMYLLRILTLDNLRHNHRVFTSYIAS